MFHFLIIQIFIKIFNKDIIKPGKIFDFSPQFWLYIKIYRYFISI
uniref:Uncharacterized protein n=1 Tax=viral metagenome TaxID=1070528 RepID=A0A6C0J836_9ZZZZ